MFGSRFKVRIHVLVFPQVRDVIALSRTGWPIGTKDRERARRALPPGSGGVGSPRRSGFISGQRAGRPRPLRVPEEQRVQRWGRWGGEAGETGRSSTS